MSRCVLVVLAVAATAACVTGVAHASIYWTTTQSQGVGRAALDGTNVEMPFIRSITFGGGVALNGSHIFWNGVARANLDGSDVQDPFTQLGFNGGVAVNGTHIYSGVPGGSTDGKIGRANLDGTGANSDFITGVAGPCGVAVNATHVFWAAVNGGTIGRAALDGTDVDHDFITPTSGFAPCGVAVTSTHIYWADYWNGGTTISRANLNGTGVDDDFITGASYPCGVAVHGDHIYWANQFGPAGPSIARANLDGTDVRQKFVDLSEDIAWRPCGVGVDGLVKSATTLQASATTAPFGSDVEFTATVTGAGPAPTGTVRFVVTTPMEQKQEGSAPVDATGHARWIPDEPLDSGDSVTATYRGDSHYASSKTSPVPMTITPAKTTTTIEVVPNPIVSGGSTDVLVTVENIESEFIPFGFVTMGVNGTFLNPSLELDDDGQAAFTLIADVDAGDYRVSANYFGETLPARLFQPSQGVVTVRVLPKPTATPSVPAPPVTTPPAIAAVPKAITRGDVTAMVGTLLSALKARGFKALTGSVQSLDSAGPGTLSEKIFARSKGKKRRVLIARGTTRFTPGGPRHLSIKPTPAGRKLMRRSKRLRLEIVTRFTPLSGAPVSVVRRIEVSRRGSARKTGMVLIR